MRHFFGPPGRDRSVATAFGLFLVLCIAAVILIRTGLLESPELELGDRVTPVAGEMRTTEGIPIQIGAYLENVYLFSSDDGTFDADGTVWLIFPEQAAQLLRERELAPADLLHFVNRIDDWDFSLEPRQKEPLRLSDGRSYQAFRFSGHFYVNDLDFHRFPFQTVRLPLVLELYELGTEPERPVLNLLPDRTASGVASYVSVVGYRTVGFHIASGVREYATDFGLGGVDSRAHRTRQVSFVVSYQRSVNSALLTLFLPLIVLMALVLFSPMLSASLWDVRLGIPPMALLTLIFLQQGYRDKLPELPYITFMDVIYNLCYFVNLILFALFLWGSNRLHLASEEERPDVVRSLDVIDRRFQLGLSLAIILLALVNWFVIASRFG